MWLGATALGVTGITAETFAPAGGVYYAYSIVPRGDGSVALRAQGDLDGDGTLSTIEKGCYPTATGCDCSGPATRTNELE